MALLWFNRHPIFIPIAFLPRAGFTICSANNISRDIFSEARVHMSLTSLKIDVCLNIEVMDDLISLQRNKKKIPAAIQIDQVKELPKSGWRL